MSAILSMFHMKLLFFVRLFSILVFSSQAFEYEDLYPIVTINQGLVQGLKRSLPSGKIFYSFKGIPYAKPPVGPLRFRDPVPYGNWSGVWDAFEDKSICVQMETFPFQGNEDCLYINIYTPSLQNNRTKYPVMLFIHGGGWVIGDGIEIETPPKLFIEQDIIMVSFHYRLGMFGFLSLDTPEVPGNAALKDQHLAIKWVKENIAHFNGDDNNIVLSGSSAGSASIEYHLLHKKSKGLFHKTRMQSGSLMSSWAYVKSNQRSLEKLAHVLGVNNPAQILNTLDQMSSEDIHLVEQMCKDDEFIRKGLIFSPFVPVVEKEFPNVESFLTVNPLELLKNREFLNVPSLVTFCREEGSMYVGHYGEQYVNDMRSRNYTNFIDFIGITDTENINKNLTMFYQSMNVDEMEQVIEFISDIMFFTGIHRGLKLYVDSNLNQHYAYSFSFVGNVTHPPPFPPGAPHVIDIFYLWYYEEGDLNDEEREIKNILGSIHGNFIKTGSTNWLGGCVIIVNDEPLTFRNPNGLSDNQFDPITADVFNVLHIGNDGIFMTPFPYSDRMDYWDNLFQ